MIILLLSYLKVIINKHMANQVTMSISNEYILLVNIVEL